MLLQRIFASVLLLVCVGLALMAWPYQAAFSYEPVGPRAFPLLMLGLMGLGLIYMIFRPTQFAVCHMQRWQNQVISSRFSKRWQRLHNVRHSLCFNIFLCCSFLYW